MKGYKAFDEDLKCRDMQYEIGKEYTFDGEPIPCVQGFHFCKSIPDCYKFYEMLGSTRICEIIATGDIKTDDEIKYCTNKIKIVCEVENPRVKSNASDTNSGYCNSGSYNSGFYNSGHYNSGDFNSGNHNSGNQNSGFHNSGSRNSGNCNPGDQNLGHCNSGSYNLGHYNSGNYNSGSRNSGDWNSGSRNSGDWNSGNYNSGIFNTAKAPKIKIFDTESEWTISDWFNSEAYNVMQKCPYTQSVFIASGAMSDKEKEYYPEYKTRGGYINTIMVTDKDRQVWWDALSSDERQAVYNLPNFDAEKFEMCTGITVNPESEKDKEVL